MRTAQTHVHDILDETAIAQLTHCLRELRDAAAREAVTGQGHQERRARRQDPR